MASTIRNVIVGADRGGVSKTLITAAIVDTIVARKGTVKLVEYEVEPRIDQIVGKIPGLGAIENRKVSSDVRLAAGAMKDDEKAAAELAKWDAMFDDLGEGGRVYDTAANMLSEMMNGLAVQADEVSDILGNGERLGFVIPTTAERYAYAAVPGLVAKIRNQFPKSPIWIVENQRDGEFAHPTDAYNEARGQANVVTVPNYNTNCSTRLTKMPLSILSSLDRIILQEMFDLRIGPAARETVFLRHFAKGLAQAVDPIAAWFLGQEAVAIEAEAKFPSAA